MLLWKRYGNNKMAAICYYGNVMTTTRWRLYVTMETLWQQQDGGYALLFYIFNSTVIDWTCFFIGQHNKNTHARTNTHQKCLYLVLGVHKYRAQCRLDDYIFTVARSVYGDSVWNLLRVTCWRRELWGGSWIVGKCVQRSAHLNIYKLPTWCIDYYLFIK